MVSLTCHHFTPESGWIQFILFSMQNVQNLWPITFENLGKRRAEKWKRFADRLNVNLIWVDIRMLKLERIDDYQWRLVNAHLPEVKFALVLTFSIHYWKYFSNCLPLLILKHGNMISLSLWIYHWTIIFLPSNEDVLKMNHFSSLLPLDLPLNVSLLLHIKANYLDVDLLTLITWWLISLKLNWCSISLIVINLYWTWESRIAMK